MSAKRVLSVGQCSADHGNLSRTFRQAFDAAVVGADGADEAISQLQSGDFGLVLINRIFDADGDSGLDLIRRLKADESLSSVPVMLVSNYDDAQQLAKDAGAVPGFGKGALGHPAMLERVRPYIS